MALLHCLLPRCRPGVRNPGTHICAFPGSGATAGERSLRAGYARCPGLTLGEGRKVGAGQRRIRDCPSPPCRTRGTSPGQEPLWVRVPPITRPHTPTAPCTPRGECQPHSHEPPQLPQSPRAPSPCPCLLWKPQPRWVRGHQVSTTRHRDSVGGSWAQSFLEAPVFLQDQEMETVASSKHTGEARSWSPTGPSHGAPACRCGTSKAGGPHPGARCPRECPRATAPT